MKTRSLVEAGIDEIKNKMLKLNKTRNAAHSNNRSNKNYTCPYL